jgi:hypothetical protein
MIEAALVFSNPAAFGLPHVRGIFLRMLKRIDASLHLMRVALGLFPKISYFPVYFVSN